ncbi:MAG: SdiA-regulated domain-containing protein, partial [Bacteroidota bacterium]
VMLKQLPLMAFLLGTLVLQCRAPKKKVSHRITYDFENPLRILELESDLVEISGIAWWSKDTLAAIEDEKGKIYFIDLANGKVLNKTDFGEKGDYEDVAVRNRKLYVLKSNGDIFKVKDPFKKEAKVKKMDTSLSKKDDLEGLCYFSEKDCFLLGAKEPGEIKGKRVIYELKRGNDDIEKEPYLIIDEDNLMDEIHKKYGDRIGKNFKPSGLEIHPISGDLYVISAINRILAVFDKKNQLKEAIRLPKSYAKQAEGICFAPDGTLYISSEGVEGKGKITELKMK